MLFVRASYVNRRRTQSLDLPTYTLGSGWQSGAELRLILARRSRVASTSEFACIPSP